MIRLLALVIVALLITAFLATRALDEPSEHVIATEPSTTTTVLSDRGVPELNEKFGELVEAMLTTTTTAKPRSAPRPPKPRAGITYPTDMLLHDLALCETGGTMDQHATSHTNPPYFSYFQWALSTWQKMGGKGDPRDASYETQVPLARKLILSSGWHSQFPRCSNVIGVSG